MRSYWALQGAVVGLYILVRYPSGVRGTSLVVDGALIDLVVLSGSRLATAKILSATTEPLDDL